ncbi:LysR family transcriptional regulator [Sphingomonas lutea]|uniref:LysR family transcriptional regulator n=2 Tax=Sphingomonas lutea TaxID=1045317 RepID=A0A7G9SL26_9SPHN|nr:LysR family transcriptional regulator [Sphingomonas lutea]
MMDWDDLRYFLAVAREGSTLRAGRALRTSQTTVARRIAALEQALGFPLFEKRQAGYALTPAGEELLAKAGAVEQAIDDFAGAASGQARAVRGTVKITTEEIYAITLLTPLLTELHQRFPDIVIELDTSQKVRDLGAGEADVSLRSTAMAQPAGLVGRRLCIDDWALYCSRAYGERHGVPTTIEELRSHSFIGGGGGNLWIHYQAWLQALGLEQQVAMHHATSGGLLSGVRAGFGIAVLPCVVADADPDLIRCMAPRHDHERVLWLFTHERVRHTPRVRTVIDFLYERLSRHVQQLEATRTAAAA